MRNNQRIYLQYLDDLGEEITLSFRSEESLIKHIEKNKISKSDISYLSNKPPSNSDTYASVSSVKSIVGTYDTSFSLKGDFTVV